MAQGIFPLISQTHHFFPLPRDYELEACVMTELLYSRRDSTIAGPQKLISQVLELFELFDNADLECM
jgi:hypothetical protein